MFSLAKLFSCGSVFEFEDYNCCCYVSYSLISNLRMYASFYAIILSIAVVWVSAYSLELKVFSYSPTDAADGLRKLKFELLGSRTIKVILLFTSLHLI